MLTKTEIANNALSLLSAGTISNILDNDDEKSRVISANFKSAAQSVIRSHRWSCCVRRAKLQLLADAPIKEGSFGYAYSFQLPSDSLRFLDLNGEPWSSKTRTFDVNGRVLLTNDPKANIRYVAWVENTEEWDVLLAEAVAVFLAMRIARRITKDGMSGENLMGLYKETLSNAMKVDAMEVGSGENSPLERILESSPLVQAGQTGGAFRRGSRVGLEVNLEQPRP